MTVSRHIRALAAVAIAAVAITGCNSGREFNAGREGRPVTINNLAYDVFISRILNLKDPEDGGYYQGPEAPPGYELFGVFISVCNQARGGPAYASAPLGNFKIVDTSGNVFRPIPIPVSNQYAYHGAMVPHESCIPIPGSLPASGPTGGALVLFQLPIQAAENRPLDLIIHGPAGPGGQSEVQRIELDI